MKTLSLYRFCDEVEAQRDTVLVNRNNFCAVDNLRDGGAGVMWPLNYQRGMQLLPARNLENARLQKDVCHPAGTTDLHST